MKWSEKDYICVLFVPFWTLRYYFDSMAPYEHSSDSFLTLTSANSSKVHLDTTALNECVNKLDYDVLQFLYQLEEQIYYAISLGRPGHTQFPWRIYFFQRRSASRSEAHDWRCVLQGIVHRCPFLHLSRVLIAEWCVI